MKIKLNFEQEGDMRRVHYRITRSIFGYIFGFILLLLAELITYSALSAYSAFNGIPLYFHLILIALLIFAYMPYRVTLMYNLKRKDFTAVVKGFFFYKKRNVTYENFKKLESAPVLYLSLVGKYHLISSPVLSRLISEEQVEEIAKYFGLKSFWLNCSLGQEPAFGIPLKK